MFPSPLVEIIKNYPAELKKDHEIDELVDQADFGNLLSFTFVRGQDYMREKDESSSDKLIVDKDISKIMMKRTRDEEDSRYTNDKYK